MSTLVILLKNIKWRFNNPLTIIITILQPVIWLVLYSVVASKMMEGTGINNYTAYILPGLIVLVSFGACSSSGIMNYLMKSQGSFQRILIAPISRKSIILGQILEAIGCTFLEIFIMIVLSMFYSVNIIMNLKSFGALILLIFLTAFLIAAITYSLSLLFSNEVIYETVMNAIVLPIFFLSSALFPIASITGILKVIINLNPFTHIINNIRTIILTGTIQTNNFSFTIILLVILCTVAFMLAYYRLNKEMDL